MNTEWMITETRLRLIRKRLNVAIEALQFYTQVVKHTKTIPTVTDILRELHDDLVAVETSLQEREGSNGKI